MYTWSWCYLKQLVFQCKCAWHCFFFLAVSIFVICVNWLQTNVLAKVLITSCYLKLLQWPKLNCTRTLLFVRSVTRSLAHSQRIQRPITNRIRIFLIHSHCNLLSLSFSLPLPTVVCSSLAWFLQCSWRGYNFSFHYNFHLFRFLANVSAII